MLVYITARSESLAFDSVQALYPNWGALSLVSRKNAQGQFSNRGRYFTFRVYPKHDIDLGEEEY